MIEKLIKAIARELDGNKIPYMIIGGQAVLLYGSPRLTNDIDITLGIDADHYLQLRSICTVLKFKILPSKPEAFVKQTNVLPVEDVKSKIRIDFIFSFTPYENQALKRIRKIKMSNYSVKFASPEDVIIHKMFAGRAIDNEDVKNILIKNKSKINLHYINKWLKKFSSLPEQGGIVKKFKNILKRMCI